MSKTAKETVKKMKKVDVNASLISAVMEGDLGSVKKLVGSHGLSCCECESGGYLLLVVAIKLGHIEIAEFLLQKGAKANCKTGNITTPLHLATRQRFAGLVQLLLEKNAAVDVRNNENETPLHLAAKAGYADIVEILLRNNASLTVQTNECATPLFLAAAARHETVIQMLLKHACINLKYLAKTRNSTLLNHVLLCNPSICEKVNRLVLSIITQDEGQSKIVDELVDHGFLISHEFLNKSLLLATISKNYIKLIDSILKNKANHNITENYPQLLHTAVKLGLKEMAETLLKSGFNANATDEKGKTSLCYALSCKEDDKYVVIIRLLLTYGADITKAAVLLHEAVIKGLIEVCKVLIENGADVNKLDIGGRMPLFLAVSEERNSIADEPELEGSNQIEEIIRCKIIELLLNGGADVNMYVRGFTAFHHAVIRGRKTFVSNFLKLGVDVNTRAQDGTTPLYLAARKGDAEIVEILCENNADVNAGWGEISPLRIATSELKPIVVELLLKFGASINFNIQDIASENCESEDDFSSDYYDTEGSLFYHLLKLKVAGFYVVDQSYEDCYYYDYYEFQEECEEELNQLKNVKLNLKYTLYDVLVNDKNLGFVKDKPVARKLKSLNLDTFPKYKYLIKSNLRKNSFRLELLRSGQKWLDVLIKTGNKLNGKKYSVLPIEILEQIVAYLSNSELKSLISCGKALKHQLHQQ